MSFPKIFFNSCLFFFGGVFIASFLNFYFLNAAFEFFPLIFIFSLFLLIAFYYYAGKLGCKNCVKGASVFVIFFSSLLFGVFWEEKFEAEITPEPNSIHYFNDKGEITFESIILQEIEKKAKSNQIVAESKKIISCNGCDESAMVKGKVLITLPPFTDFDYGDRIQIKGKIETPKNFISSFDYKEYLRKERIYSIMHSPEVSLISSGNGNLFFAQIFFLKEKLKKTAKILLPPEGAILSAITLGDKSRLSQNFKDKLAASGLSHITAISGMHIMVLFGIFVFIFLWLGFWRWQATILTVLILAFYVLMIGAPPSAIRAGIMGGLLYFGWTMGRLNQSSRTIVFAAAGMVFLNPLILTRDIGFQLSFLASLGIIYLFPIFEKWLRAEDSKVKQLIALTFAAQIFCFPILVFNFGQFSILAPISNILAVPLLPFLLGGGFLYLILGTIFSFLALPFSFILQVPFAYLTKIVEFISSCSFSAIALNIHWSFILFFYAFLGWFIFRAQDRKRKLMDIKDKQA